MKPLPTHDVVLATGDARLIHGDAFIEMSPIGDVDCIITDPPYNPKTHKGARTTRRHRSVALVDLTA